MQTRLNILHLEDDRLDADRIRETLAAQGTVADMKLVHTEAAFRAALMVGNIDLVLSDYSLPGFSGLSALNILRETNPELPFIFVTGERAALPAEYQQRPLIAKPYRPEALVGRISQLLSAAKCQSSAA